MGAIRRISRSVKRVAPQGTHNVNVADPSNVVISTGSGESGSVHTASSSQRVRVRQDGDETIEETETFETRT